MSLSTLIEVGRRALATQQTLLATTGQNIANTDTEGYSRRKVTVTPAPSITTPQGQLGTGVDATAIKRVRDDLIDRTLHQEQPVLGLYEEQRDALQRIEGMVNEPSNTGLNAVLSRLFNSFRGLADAPENAGVRATVLGSGQAVAETFHRLDRQFGDLRRQLLESAGDKADRINELTTQIANLNRAVAGVERIRGEASEERDRRDMAVDELSKIINIDVVKREDGTLNVSVGGMTLVVQARATALRLRTVQIGATAITQVVRADTDEVVPTAGGSLHGLLQVRNEVLDYRRRLDDIAVTLVREVNSVHAAGYGTDGGTGRPFFSPEATGAGNIAVDAGIESNIKTIAASLDGAAGDNRNAMALARIEDLAVVDNGVLTLSGSYRAMVGDIGARSRAASSSAQTQQLIVSKLKNDRSSVSGVSLDEEAANLIAQQRAYQAAARLVRTADDMTQTLLAMLR